MSNLRIKAIQYNTEELYPILDSLSNGFNIIYSNLKSCIKLNGMKFKNRKFDTMLYNEEDKIIILLMRGGIITKEDILEYLEIYEKPYAEITFESSQFKYQDDNNIPELIFINDKKELCNELTQYLTNKIYDCKYYPLLNGTTDLGYMGKYGQRFTLDKKSYKGVLHLDNKLILLSDKNNLNESNVINILKTFQITYKIDKNNQPNLFIEDEEKVKSLKLQRFEYFK